MIDGPCTVLQRRQNLNAVRRTDRPADATLRIRSCRNERMHLRQDLHRWRRPAQQGLVHNSQGEHVVAGKRRILSPRQGRSLILQGIGQAVDVHFPKVAEIAALDQLLHDALPFQPVGTRHNLRNQTWVAPGGSQHAMGLGGVESHACLGQHMFAGFQGGQRDRAMQVRPGPDHHGIDIRIGDKVLPVWEGPPYAEFACRRRR